MKNTVYAALVLCLTSLPAAADIVKLSSPATVKVYSGDHLVYQGAVDNHLEILGQGVFVFQDKCSANGDKSVVVSGTVVVTQDGAACPH